MSRIICTPSPRIPTEPRFWILLHDLIEMISNTGLSVNLCFLGKGIWKTDEESMWAIAQWNHEWLSVPQLTKLKPFHPAFCVLQNLLHLIH